MLVRLRAEVALAIGPLRALPVVVAVVTAGCIGQHDLPPQEIEKLARLSDVMRVQESVAEPQFKKLGTGQYSDADWAELTDTSVRIKSTSRKMLQFSKGPEFDLMARQEESAANKLGAAAAAKSTEAANSALTEMQNACKACHARFR